MLRTFLLLLAVPTFMWAQSPNTYNADFVKKSDVIVTGKVSHLAPQWTAGKAKIQTVVSVVVDQSIKGNAPGNTLAVIVPGGEIDGVGELYSHTVKFQQNENVVLFAKRDQNGTYRVAGGENGKLSVKTDNQTGTKNIPGIGKLDEFTTRIKQIVKSQGGTTKQK